MRFVTSKKTAWSPDAIDFYKQAQRRHDWRGKARAPQHARVQHANEVSGAADDLTNAIKAAGDASNQFRDLPRLTFDSWATAMQKYGYPAEQTRSILNLVWPLLPDKWKNRLTKRSAPAASAGEKPIVPASASTGEKVKAKVSSIPWLWIAGGVAAVGAAVVIVPRVMRKAA